MTIFARNLFRRVFSSEDISGHSLTGRRSTSLQNHVPLPSVDPLKRDAVIEFCLKTHGYEISASSSKKFLRKRKSAKTSIIKSLSDYIREENSKLKAF
ncbi:unnamed protein product [Allacma fusca]|uniref:BEN domain-containing protein n=1 Tax=Allacma fusca TaxID=39272 RepID=A0A8J2PNN3_9HEXA|nr:unnamed protein product [Allacma fusca]